MSVIISHTSVAPFVQQAALALQEAGWLDRFVTTLRYDASSRRQRLACRVAAGVGFDLERQLRRRTVTALPFDRVESLPWSELLRLLVSKLDRDGRVGDLVWSRTEPAFDRAVARRLTSGHRAVYGFEYSSLATFTRAKEIGLHTIYDMPAPEPRFVQQIIDGETARFPVLETAYYHHTAKREESRIARRRAEWAAADLVIAASTFTRDSFAKAGLDVSKVRIVPYGAPPAISADIAGAGGSRGDRLELLWAGTFSVRKGAHYLLDAWRRHHLGRHARLRVFGAVTLPDALLNPIPEGVEFGGSIPRDELMAHYQNSDALMFPTLCDGFGMVATEAWSRGLPVLTTRCAGAFDLLRERENGLVFQAADADSLAETVEWCLRNREALRAMRIPSQQTAAGWQWADYRHGLQNALSPLLGNPSPQSPPS
jgi:glycosyltransferase involved in cell wall biosynthesis